MMRSILIASLSLGLVMGTPTSNAFAVGSAGVENAAFSAKSLGQANAVVARPEEPATIMFNPAGLVELEGIQFSGGIQNIDWHGFHESSLTGDKTQSDPRLLILPSFAMSVNPGKAFDNRLAFGVAVNSPFGGFNSWPAR